MATTCLTPTLSLKTKSLDYQMVIFGWTKLFIFRIRRWITTKSWCEQFFLSLQGEKYITHTVFKVTVSLPSNHCCAVHHGFPPPIFTQPWGLYWSHRSNSHCSTLQLYSVWDQTLSRSHLQPTKWREKKNTQLSGTLGILDYWFTISVSS